MLRQKFDFWNGNESVNHVFANLKPRFPRGGGGGGEGYSWEFLVEVCHLVLQILTLSQTKKCHFPHSFSDQTSFQNWPLDRNYVIITKIRAQTKKF